MGTMLDGTETYDWWLEDFRGRKWTLFGDEEGDRGVTFESISGAENSIIREMTASSHQVGETISGWHVEKLEPTLRVAISTRGRPEVWTDWLAAWSQKRECTLFCRNPHTQRVKRLTSRLQSGRQSPEAEPHLSGLTIQELPLLAPKGVWVGSVQVLNAGDVWVNPGDLPPLISYYPKAAGEIGLGLGPDVWTATHPVFPAGTEVDLDPEARMKTRVNGVVEPVWFSTWRNKWNPLQVQEGQELDVVAAAGEVAVTPRFLGPW